MSVMKKVLAVGTASVAAIFAAGTIVGLAAGDKIRSAADRCFGEDDDLLEEFDFECAEELKNAPDEILEKIICAADELKAPAQLELDSRKKVTTDDAVPKSKKETETKPS